jgi:hypothetical protein
VKEEKKDTKEDKKEDRVKFARRISARITSPFTQRKKVDTPSKVEEAAPKIDEPKPIAPLENPASDLNPIKVEEPPKEETKETNEAPKIIDHTPAHVVATA